MPGVQQRRAKRAITSGADSVQADIAPPTPHPNIRAMRLFSRRPEPPSDPPPPTPIEILINTIAGYISPRAREERHQKEIGHPAEDRSKREYLAEHEALYRRGFPVAGHGEAERINNPAVRHRNRMVP
jgi:hypothetical protein